MFKLSDLEKFNDTQLLELAFESMKKVKPVLLEKVNIQSELKLMDIADADLVKQKISYENQDKKFIVRIPFGDERQIPEYQISMFSDFNDIFPPAGYFIYIDGEIIEQPFGLLEVFMYGQHIERNENEHKFLKFNNQYKKNECFYYDYKSGNYIQLNEKELKKALFNKSQGRDLENERSEIQEYIQRLEVYRYLQVRLKEIGNSYIREFSSFKKYWRVAPVTIEEAEIYFKKYKRFLDSIKLGLQVKLLFSRMTQREYEKLLEAREQQYDLISEGEKVIKSIERLMNSYSDIKNYNLGSLFEGSQEQRLYVDLINNVIMKIQKFLTPRGTDLGLQGYVSYDLERGELYPNIVELERRAALSSENWKEGKERDLQAKILNNLKQKSSV